MKLEHADVQEIIRLLDDSDYDELQIETEQFRLILCRSQAGEDGWSQQRQTLTEPNVVTSASGVAAADATGGAEAGTEQAGEKLQSSEGLVEVSAPITGTFYRAQQPGAEPFVEIGSITSPDSVIAIIEVMKLMNSVQAGIDGDVVDICVADAEFVERGQCLMRIKPNQERP